MKRCLTGLAVIAWVLGVQAATNDLGVARAALRDELWEVARAHAGLVPGDEAKLIVLESHAAEKNWRRLLEAIDAMGYPSGEGFSYYRAAALMNEGSLVAASNVLANVTFAETNYAHAAARLRAQLALKSDDVVRALEILRKDGGEDVETKMLTASILANDRDREKADRLWREVITDANSSERARATAAACLPDRAMLAELSTNAMSGAVRRLAALRLGVLLVKDPSRLTEGERIIRETVRDKPDADGARESFLTLGEALLDAGRFTEAAKTFDDALEIWPEASKDAALHEGRGWAMLKTGRANEAMDEFGRAEELAPTAERKAAAALKIADALSASGRAKEATAAYQRVRDEYAGTDAASRVADVIRLREKEESGRALYRAFRFDEARKVFAELAAEDPQSRERIALYGVKCAYGAGDDDAAENAARELAKGARDAAVRAEAGHWLAKFEFNRGHWREAGRLFADFAAAAPGSPDAPMALVWSARASLADNDFAGVIATVARLAVDYPTSPVRVSGMLAQGEALIELGRFDEAVLVLDRAALVSGATDADRLSARIMRADALFAMGADNPARYKAALEAYHAIRTGEALTPGMELSLSFKVAKTLEKLKRLDEATDAYYTQVVLAYRTGRIAGTRYDDAARATFARAAFRLAEEFESRGRIRQAIHVLDLVRTSDVPAADEAAKRMDALIKKGMF